MANFTLKTTAEIYELLKQKAKQLNSDSSWSGLQDQSLEGLIAQLVAEASSIIINNADFRAQQAYLDTVQTMIDMKSIAENLGLTVGHRTGATANLSIVAANDVTIPLGTEFSTSNGELFCSTAALVLSSATSLSGTVEVVHSEYERLSFRAAGNQLEEINLNRDNVLIGDLTVTVDGTVWSRVTGTSGLTASDTVYIASFDRLGNVTCIFGDGVYGSRLPADAQIIVDVFYGGGVAGNSVAAAEITSVNSSFTNSDNISSVTNAAAPSGGQTADNIALIRTNVAGAASTIAGVVSLNNVSGAVRNQLTWAADAIGVPDVASSGTPVIKLVAFPSASAVTDLSGAQSTALSEFIANRGVVGVVWTVESALSAAVELELEVRLANSALQLQKTAEIKNALTDDTGALFSFAELGFDNSYTRKAIEDAVLSVDGVTNARVIKFSRLPGIYNDTNTVLADTEIGLDAKDGYYQLHATDTDTADVHFFEEFTPDKITSGRLTDSSKNWLVEQHSFATQANLGSGHLKQNASKLEFKQLDRVWQGSQFNGSHWSQKHLIGVSWTEATGDAYESFYHINTTTAPDTIISLEDSDSPINNGGKAIDFNFASGAYSDIVVNIYEDKTQGATGTFGTAGNLFIIAHNNANNVYLSDSSAIPVVSVNQRGFISFSDDTLEVSSGNYIPQNDILKIRLDTTKALVAGDLIKVFINAYLSSNLEFKRQEEVFELLQSNITVRFV